MKHELLYSTTQAYIEESMAFAELHSGQTLQMYGRGEGTVDWSGRSGVIEWTNFPARRPDDAFLPDVTGVIRLEGEDHPIMYRMHGISLLPDEAGRRLFGGPVRWYTAHPDFLWMNDVWGYEEGELAVETSTLITTAFALRPESQD